MSVISVPVGFAGMARKEAVKTDQVNFRFPVDLIVRLESFRDRHPLNPTVTNILIAAAKDWLDKHEPELPPRPKR